MSTPSHHVPEELLFDYAAGTAPEAVSLFVATHLAICPTCRDEVGMLEQLGANLLEGLAPESTVAALPELARLDELADAVADADRSPTPMGHPEWQPFPEPLRSYMTRQPDGRIAWTFKMPGMRYLDIPLTFNGIPVRISVLLGGSVFPRHTHDGAEMSLVLTGGYTDRGQDYVRGDAAVADASITHHLDIHRGEACTLLVVNEHRMIPKSLAARALAKLFAV